MCSIVPGKTRTPQTESHGRPKKREPKIPAWYTMSFIEVTHRNMGKGLLIGTEMTQWHHQETTPIWVTDHKPGNLELPQLAGSSTSWRVSFPDGPGGLSLFQATWPVWASSRKLSLSEIPSQPSLLLSYACGGRISVFLLSQRLPEASGLFTSWTSGASL